MDYPASPSGFWKVQISRVIDVNGFRYKPGLVTTVDEVTLEALILEEAVSNVVAAD